MPWLRTGDTAATHPRYLALFELDDVDATMRIAAFGFVSLCATLSAAHTSDYLVSYGVACQVGHGAERALLDICVRAGLMEEVEVDGVHMWKIVDDPEFLHMRTKEEIEWERQRKADNANPELIIPVRLRDGDACRYCGQVVNWRARKGRIAGTYDHRVPGKGATIDTLVVSCSGCNASRSNDPLADERHPLLPAPTKPYYSPHTREWIAAHDWAKANGYSIDHHRGGAPVPPGTVPDDRQDLVAALARPSNQPDTAPITAATQQPAGARAPQPTQRADTQSDTAHRSDPTPRRIPRTEQRPDTPSDNAHPTAAARTARRRTDHHRARPTPDTAPPRPRHQPGHANPPRPASTPDLPDPADPADCLSTGSGNTGTGRDGSVRVGNRTTRRPQDSSSSSARARSRRGRRSRNRSSRSDSGDQP